MKVEDEMVHFNKKYMYIHKMSHIEFIGNTTMKRKSLRARFESRYDVDCVCICVCVYIYLHIYIYI